MTEAKHTPGPWRTEHAGGEWQVVGSDGLCVTSGIICEADANLIAAAFDLLAVAHAVAEHFAGTDATLGEEACAAIAKAEGRQS